jgi:lysophospholipase L1-like esterase
VGLAAVGVWALFSSSPAARAEPTPPKPPDEEAPPKQAYVVAAMGDSLTDPKSQGGKYLEILRKKCPKSRFDSYGKGGNMVNQMRRRFARDVLGDPPDAEEPPKPKYTHLVLLGGINDICSDESAGRTNDKIKDDLSAMYGMAREHGMKVLALTLPPWGGFKKYYNPRRAASTFEINGWIRQQLDDGVVDGMLDVFPLLSCGEPEFLCETYGMRDRVHWSKKGHQVVGEALHAALFADCL